MDGVEVPSSPRTVKWGGVLEYRHTRSVTESLVHDCRPGPVLRVLFCLSDTSRPLSRQGYPESVLEGGRRCTPEIDH